MLIVKKLCELWGRDGRAKKEALYIVAAMLLQECELSLGLHTFGYDADAQTVPHGDNSGSKGRIALISGDTSHKGLVNFQCVQGQPPKLT